MVGSLGKFLSKYGKKGEMINPENLLALGKKAPEETKGLLEAIKGSPKASAATGGAGVLAGLGLGEAMEEDEDENKLMKLLEAIGLGE